MSAAEQQLVGWPLPAALVALIDSILNLVAMFLRAKMRELCSTDTVSSGPGSLPRLAESKSWTRKSAIRHSPNPMERKKVGCPGKTMLPVN